MTHHHHHPHHRHPEATVGPSLLRFSAAERLALAGVLVAMLWAAVMWAMA